MYRKLLKLRLVNKMVITSAELIISAAGKDQWPLDNLPEIVLAGRSNVGKSSLINALTNRKKLAYIGNTPGKTRLLNFFILNEAFIFVDVPGYGYAHLSKMQMHKFGEMMEDYFHDRIQKKGLLLIVDARHKPTEDDKTMISFARFYDLPVLVAATKIDKVKNSQKKKNLQVIKDTLLLQEHEKLIACSSETKVGLNEIWSVLQSFMDH